MRTSTRKNQIKNMRCCFLILITALVAIVASACDQTNEMGFVTEQEASDIPKYSPVLEAGWPISTPEEEGINSDLLNRLYKDAIDHDTLYGLLVIKNGALIGEKYFNGGAMDKQTLLQSVSKSYISALVEIAIEQGCLSGLDQKMVDFFPEIEDEIRDPRKETITVGQLLQMRSGYPDEESNSAYLDALYWGEYPHLIIDFPLVSDPGTAFNYSNLSFNWLAIILQRACGTDLRSFAQEHLFEPMDITVGDWLQDRDGHFIGSGGIHLTAREAAKFGQLYLDSGQYLDRQIIDPKWIQDSLQPYSIHARDYGISLKFRDMGYGYGWWSARAGDHDFWFAWGHGGQLIVILDDLNMVIVTTADPFFGQHNGNSWKHESGIMNLVGEFIASLPGQDA